jgi:hypothetical protein
MDVGAIQHNDASSSSGSGGSVSQQSLSATSPTPGTGTCDVRQTWAIAESLNTNSLQGPASQFPVLAGSTIVVTTSLGSVGDSTTDVFDNLGNHFTKLVSNTSATSTNEVAIWAFANHPGGSGITITVAASGNVLLTFGAVEVPNLGAVDKTAFNRGVSSTPSTGNTGTLSQANEFAVIALCPTNSVGQIITEPPGFIRRANESAGGAGSFQEHDGATQALNSTAALNPQWTLTNSVQWLAVIATFKCQATSSGSPSSTSPKSPSSVSAKSASSVSAKSVSQASSSQSSAPCRTIASNVVTGNLSNPANWVGGIVPGINPNFNDQVIIAAGAVITCDVPATFGCSLPANQGVANAALRINGEFVVGSSTLFKARGDTFLSNGILTLRDNCIYEYDPTQSASPSTTAYQIVQGTAAGQTSNLIRTQNTSAGNRATIRTNQTPGNAAGYISAPFNNSTFVNLSYVYFVQIGDTTNDGMTWRITAAGTTEVMDHCDMNNCGTMPAAIVNIVATSGFSITNCTWRNTNARIISFGRPLSIYLTTANAPITGTRLIDHCVTDAGFGIPGPGLTLTNSYIAKNWNATIGGVGSQWAKCDGNLVNVPGLGSPDPTSVDARIKPQGEFSNNYVLCYTGNAAADSGTATGSQTSTTFQDTTKTWTVNQYQGNGQVYGWCIYKQDGFGVNVECRSIQSNTANTLTLDFPFLSPAVSGLTTYEIVLQNANPNICDFPTLTNTAFHLHHQIFDYPGGSGAGDCYLHGSVAGSPAIVDYNIILPCASGKSTGTLVTGGGTAAGSTCFMNHNTYGAGSACFMQNETPTNANWCLGLMNGIAWVDAQVAPLLTAGNGLYKTTELPTNNPGSATQDVITTTGGVSQADFNCGWNLQPGYEDTVQFPGQGGIGYNCNSSQPMGVHDIDVNPQFLDSTRNIYKWGVSKGLTGTFCTVINQALAQMQKMNDDVGFNPAFSIKGNPNALWDWVWAGFAPQNQAIIGTASDGTTFGAVQPASSSSSSGSSGSSPTSLRSSAISSVSAKSVSTVSSSVSSISSSVSPVPLTGTLYFTGFECGDTSEIALVVGTASVQNAIVDHGGYSLRTNPVGSAVGFANLDGLDPVTGVLRPFTITDGLTTTWARFKFRPNLAPGSNDEELFSVADVQGGNDKFYLRLNSARKLVAYDRNLTLLATGNTVLSTSNFIRLEAKVGIGSSGAWEVKIAGNVEMSGTGNLGNAPAFCRLGKINNRNSQSVDWIFDDFFWSKVGYPGPGECKALVPTADGTFANGTPNGAAALWQCVDDIPPDGDTTYINQLGAGQQYTAIVGPSIQGQINSYKTFVLDRPDAGGSYAPNQLIFDLDPNGNPWTAVNVGLAQPGFTELTANQDRITTLLGMVDYVSASSSSVSSSVSSVSPKSPSAQPSSPQPSASPTSAQTSVSAPSPQASPSAQPSSISTLASPSVSPTSPSPQPSPTSVSARSPSAQPSSQQQSSVSTQQSSPTSALASSAQLSSASAIPIVCDVAQTWPIAESVSTASLTSPASLIPVQVGSTLIVTTSLGSVGDTTTDVFDNLGNHFTKIVSETSVIGINEVAIWAFPNHPGGANIAITVNASGLVQLTFGAVEVPGLGALDKVSVNRATSNTPTPGSTGTLSQANEFAVIALCPVNSGSQIITTPAGWISRVKEQSNTFIELDGATRSISSTAALNPQWTLANSVGWLAVIATFKCATPSSPSSQPSLASSLRSSLSAQLSALSSAVSSLGSSLSAQPSPFSSPSSQAASLTPSPSSVSPAPPPQPAGPGLIVLDICFFGQARHGSPNTKVVTTGLKPLVIGSGITFEVSPFLNDLFWDITDGSASLVLVNPQGQTITLPATVLGVGAQANWSVIGPVGTWVRAWVLTDVNGFHEVSQPVIFQVSN